MDLFSKKFFVSTTNETERVMKICVRNWREKSWRGEIVEANSKEQALLRFVGKGDRFSHLTRDTFFDVELHEVQVGLAKKELQAKVLCLEEGSKRVRVANDETRIPNRLVMKADTPAEVIIKLIGRRLEHRKIKGSKGE